MRASLTAFLLLSTLALTACADKAKQTPQVERPAEQIYKEAMDAAKGKEYTRARNLFEELEQQHPYSDLATTAELKSAEVSYRALKYDDAIMALDRFVELHPGHEKVPYAYYLKAMCYYEQISDVRRDQSMTQMAMDAFDVVVKRFPESEFAREASMKMDLTRDHLAGKEMEIGRYYQKKGQLNAAINRFKTVIDSYQVTAHTPEALHRLVECYTALGLKDEALREAQVLAYNYPTSRWYKDTYSLLEPSQRGKLRDTRSWINRTVTSILKP